MKLHQYLTRLKQKCFKPLKKKINKDWVRSTKVFAPAICAQQPKSLVPVSNLLPSCCVTLPSCPLHQVSPLYSPATAGLDCTISRTMQLGSSSPFSKHIGTISLQLGEETRFYTHLWGERESKDRKKLCSLNLTSPRRSCSSHHWHLKPCTQRKNSLSVTKWGHSEQWTVPIIFLRLQHFSLYASSSYNRAGWV